MATFRKTKFYTMRRDEKGVPCAVKVDGYTDGIFNYYKIINKYSGIASWFVIDPDSGLSICGMLSSRIKARDEAYKNIDAINEYRQTDRYEKEKLKFYNEKIKAGAYVFLNNTEG